MKVRLLRAGLHTRLVDAGRSRWRSLGVPLGGPADRWSMALGNALVGNPPETPALEITLAGPTLVADEPLWLAVYGAAFDLGGQPMGSTFTLAAGQPLVIGGCKTGMRAYLCVPGGFDGPMILGSVSSLHPLTDNAILDCPASPALPSRLPNRSLRLPSSPEVLRVLPGAHAALFPPEGITGQPFRVTAAADRMGVRLEAPPLPVPPELPSEPACLGAVQVTRDGQCIILGVDGQTIGGYAKIAQVIAADADLVGQLRPGQMVRFVMVEQATAWAAWEARQAELRGWQARLRLAF
ncbi:MAG: biotin-dependent carboxyltransferase family protein [Gemmataceae bacterium]